MILIKSNIWSFNGMLVLILIQDTHQVPISPGNNCFKLFLTYFRKVYQKYTLTPVESYWKAKNENNCPHRFLLGF